MHYLPLFSLSLLLLCKATFGKAQEKKDTTSIKPVTVNVYFSKQPLIGVTASAQSIDEQQLTQQQTNTLLPALNSVPGIRLEERSPGSYRLAMRGSLIRSPFGIRNTKIYIDEFPLTDAGGNTYLNLIDPLSLNAIHILKGPDGSLYGANSGGVIRMEPKGFGNIKDRSEISLTSGSYGLFQEQLSLQRDLSETYQFSFDQSFSRSDGYRENAALNKKTFQTAHQWRYAPSGTFKFFLLYADLGYRTPGGLTQAQMEENPRMARPAAGPNPGAREQKAGIYDKTWYAGISHEAKLSTQLSHYIGIFGSHTDLENPFITNYEIRKERNLGLRTYFSFLHENRQDFSWQMQLGFEGQKGWNNIDNYDNDRGAATDPQDKDRLNNMQASIFYRAMTKLWDRWVIEGSLGWNTATINYTKRYPTVDFPSGKIDFGGIWMPRLASSFSITEHIALRGSISKGYSTPTLAEVRASDNIINTALKAEEGTNYELGFRIETKDRRFMVDVSAYNYQMKNGIIRQLRENGAEYYSNAGKMKQRGIEASLHAYILPLSSSRFLRQLTYRASATRNFYKFGNYGNGEDDFSNNAITAVPNWTISNTLSLTLPKKVFLNIFHSYVSAMPLNDANTVYSSAYHLVQLKSGIDIPLKHGLALQVFAGIDNLLNEKYSLGNDINAFGNRFFNPAAPRNYYGGVKVIWGS